jgi:hypothetical protein
MGILPGIADSLEDRRHRAEFQMFAAPQQFNHKVKAFFASL